MQIVKNPFVFIGMVAISAALLLSIFSEYTSETVKKNKELDKRKNILLARYFEEAKDPNSAIIAKLSEPQELIEVYKSEIEELLFLDAGNDVVVSNDFDFSKLVWKDNKKDGSLYYFFKGAESDKRYLPLFKVKGQDGGYIVPISGKGLWSTIKGFIYIVPENRNEYTVKGISFSLAISITILVHLLVEEGIASMSVADFSIFSVSELGASERPLSLSVRLGSSHSSEKIAIGIELLSAHRSAM